MKTRVCSKCNKELPLTTEYFYRDSRNIEGFRCECKFCQQKQYAKYYKEKHKTEHEQIKQIEQDRKQRGVKLCTKCYKEYPATLEYFYNRKDSKDNLSNWCKECTKNHGKQYRLDNYDKCLNYSRNKQIMLQQDLEYLKQRAEYDKQYYQNNKERKAKYNHERYLKQDKNKIREYQRKWNEQNKDYVTKRNKEYRERTKEERRVYDIKRYNENKLCRLTSNAIGRSLKGNKAGRHWETLVPYTLEQLKSHIESQFTLSMSWDNYGTYWELDHIIPQNLFKFEKPEDKQFQICWSLLNLRPLIVSENRSRPKDGSDIDINLYNKIMNQQL